MSFVVRDCVRCDTNRVQMNVIGQTYVMGQHWEVAVACQACRKIAVYRCIITISGTTPSTANSDLDRVTGFSIDERPERTDLVEPTVSESVPDRVAFLFKEAAVCRSIERYEAAGAIFRKTIDVATRYLFEHDDRLKERNPADALRSRIKGLGEMKILEDDIVELADVVALDGNDAAHDMDPYSAEEAEALEELTNDLLDRLFVRPARVQRVKAKQIAAGQRKE